MPVIVSFLTFMGLAGLVAAVPQPGSGEHLWHRRNSTSNTLPTGSGTPVAAGASMQGNSTSTGGSAAGNSSAVLRVANRANGATPSAGVSTNGSGTPTDLQAASHCGMWDSTQTGAYSVQNLLWGEGMATSGSQCYGIDGLSGNTVSWHSVYLLSSIFYMWNLH